MAKYEYAELFPMTFCEKIVPTEWLECEQTCCFGDFQGICKQDTGRKFLIQRKELSKYTMAWI